MINKILLLFHIMKNMGFSYVFHRSIYVLKSKFGLMKKDYPSSLPNFDVISLDWWQSNQASFFFKSKSSLSIKKEKKTPILEENFKKFENGIF